MAAKKSKTQGVSVNKPERLFISRKSRAPIYIPRWNGKFVSKRDYLNLKEIAGQFPDMEKKDVYNEYMKGSFSAPEQPPYSTFLWDIAKLIDDAEDNNTKVFFVDKDGKEKQGKRGQHKGWQRIRYYLKRAKDAGISSDELSGMQVRVSENENNNSITFDFTGIDNEIE